MNRTEAIQNYLEMRMTSLHQYHLLAAFFHARYLFLSICGVTISQAACTSARKRVYPGYFSAISCPVMLPNAITRSTCPYVYPILA